MAVGDWWLANGDALQQGVFVVLLMALAAAEAVHPFRPGPMQRRVRWPTNLLFTVANILVLSALPVSMLTAAQWAEAHHWGLLNQWAPDLAVPVGVTLAARALVSYGTHYAMHAVPVLWRLHRVHHLDTELDVTSTVRFHPFELIVQAVPGIAAALALGFVPWVLVLYETLDVAVTLWTHSNLSLPPAVDRVLRYIVVTPDTHRIHHSAWAPETNSNYGAVFPWWDLVFGTFTRRARHPQAVMPLGLDEVRGADAHRPWWLLRSLWMRELQPAGHADQKGDRH